MKPIVFDTQAEDEYVAAVDYYEQQRPGLGLDLQMKVEQALADIRQYPERFSAYQGEGVRQYILSRFPYSILYAELDDRIWIAAVAHHKRRPGYWALRKPE